MHLGLALRKLLVILVHQDFGSDARRPSIYGFAFVKWAYSPSKRFRNMHEVEPPDIHPAKAAADDGQAAAACSEWVCSSFKRQFVQRRCRVACDAAQEVV